MTTQIIKEDAHFKNEIANKGKAPEGHNIGILLDQEKAYDRVNMDYLRKALAGFGFSVTIIDCVYNPLEYNTINVSINGYFMGRVRKERGLQQDDPLSSILYNLAFEPLLCDCLSNENLHNYEMITYATTIALPLYQY
jgi:hypothetical protein